jgi:starch-binding outer membrane protein, SusD/RagB family
MTHMTPFLRRYTWQIVRVALPLAAAIVAACSDFLVAENPGAVEEQLVNDPANITIIANGPIGTFQDAHDDVAYWNGQLTDEIVNRNNVNPFIEEGQIDRRELYSDMTYINAFMYGPLQRARFVADDAARRLKIILGDTATQDIRVARSLAYAGYNYAYLGEMNCTTPIDLGVPRTSEEMFADAITRFEEAITIATAARTYLQTLPTTTANTNAIAAADSVRNFALVGAARAALNRDEKARAIAFANQVPANFEFRAYYNGDINTANRNRTFERLTIGNNATLAGTPFEAMTTDPRVPRTTTAGARLNTPLAASSYSSYNNNVAGAAFTSVTWVRIASSLEAQYIIAEAQGPTAATLTFVNQRRAAGNQPAVTLADEALMAELRDQRARDFYLTNHRLGDLRRYKRYYNVDLLPRGPYPGSTTGQTYNETIDCWPLPTNELVGNPNIPG